jgi:membrane-bound ClpP family serine protease
MMTPTYWAIALFLFGLFLVSLEAFIPSAGVLGLVAGSVLVWSVYQGFVASTACGISLIVATVIALPLLFAGFVKWWPLTPLGKRMLISLPDDPDELLPDGEFYRQIQSQVGKRGTAVTDLLPNGRITIEGREFDAVTEGVLVDAGTPIEVTDVQGNRIIVRPLASSPAVVATPEPESKEVSQDFSQASPDLEVDPFDDPLA